MCLSTPPYNSPAAQIALASCYLISGHLDLAKKTGATIVYGPTAVPNFDAYIAKDNEEMKVGDVTIKVLHTPGHTMESTTYLLRDEEGKDYGIFTGDTLFLGDVGRPDLAIKQGEHSLSTHASLMAQPAFKAMGFGVDAHESVELNGQRFDRARMSKNL